MCDGEIIRVSNIQRLCVNDGPGVRTTIFLKGCYLSCPWCCNPEMINYDSDLFFKRADCKEHLSGRLCAECEELNGIRSKQECPHHVFEKTFVDYTQQELYDLIIRDNYYYENGGGVTFSGGEPILQSSNIKSLLHKLRDLNINIALETSLYAPYNAFLEIAPYINYWLIDLKFQFGFFPNHSCSFQNDFEKSLGYLRNNYSTGNVKFRMVVMKEVLNHIDTIADQLIIHGITHIELLSYHKLGLGKYNQLGKSYHVFELLSKSEMEYICEILRYRNVITSYLTH